MCFCQGDLVVISRAENSQKRAGMLQDMHYRNISQRLVLLRRLVTMVTIWFVKLAFIQNGRSC